MVMGRPTKYDPSMCATVIELGKQGKSKVQMACALGVLKETMNEWAYIHPDFSAALNIATQHAQDWWESQAEKGLWENKKFATALWAKNITCRFPNDYGQSGRVDITNSDGSLSNADKIADKLQLIMAAAKARKDADGANPAGDDGLDLV